MKTNITMVSNDRNLFGVTVRQQTKDSWLNLSDLQDAYDSVRVQEGWSSRSINDVLNSGNRSNQERIYYLLEKQEVIKMSLISFMQEVENDGFVKTLKKYGAYKTTGARLTKTTWCNPYVWVLVAMEMNTKLYAETVIWLTDQLLISRIEAGNFCKSLNAAINKYIMDADFSRIARGVNFIIFGKHETGIRNSGTSAQLKELTRLEEKVAYAIENGWLRSQEDVIKHLTKLYYHKFPTQKQVA